MFTWITLLYSIPLIAVLVIAGALVGPRVNPSARMLLWTGIVILCVTQLASMFAPMMLSNRTLMWMYQATNVGLFVLRLVGTVLLIMAAGRAARGPATVYPGQAGYGQPGQAGWTSGQPGFAQPSGQPGYGQQPSGQPGYSAQQPPATQPGQSPGYGRPGQWGSDQPR